MPRQPRFCPAGLPVHVIQRGINRQACFKNNADYAAYAHWLNDCAQKYAVDINGWVFMTNHVHLLLTPQNCNTSISKLMQSLGRLYVRHFNHQHARSGGLFEGRFRSSLIQDDQYLLTCLRYIELNPVRAAMVDKPGDYQWSSFSAHAFGRRIAMLTPHPLYQSLGATRARRQSQYRQLIGETLTADEVARIRHCTNKGLVMGDESGYRAPV